jgi:hypothetical protein
MAPTENELIALIRRAFAHKPKVPPQPTTVMFDSTNLDEIPPGAPAVAGYTSGFWPTFEEIPTRFPKAKHLSIAVNSSHDADCLDVETGDAVPSDAPGWVVRQRGRGVKRPVVYANLSTMPMVVAALQGAKIPRSTVRLWVAHYIYVKPALVPGGFDAIQWTDKAFGRVLDQSLLVPSFFV